MQTTQPGRRNAERTARIPDELAAVCAELDRYAFLFAVAQPRLRGATGAPVNPLAFF